MPTGKRLAEDALASSMPEIGWTPRARGWFTKVLGEGQLGVAAVGASTRKSDPGTAQVTLHIGLRHEGVEGTVANLLGTHDDYRRRTTVTSIGYLLAQPRWTEWLVTPQNAMTEMQALASLVQEHASPYLARLSQNSSDLIAESDRMGLPGSVRYCVLLATFRGHADALQASEAFSAEAATASAEFGSEARRVSESVRQWLTSRASV